MNRRLELGELIEANRTVTAPGAEARERNRSKIAARVASGAVIGASVLATRRAAAELSTGSPSGAGATASSSTAGSSGALAGAFGKWVLVSALLAVGGGFALHAARRQLFAGSAESVASSVASPRSLPAVAPELPVARAEEVTPVAATKENETARVPYHRSARPSTPSVSGGADDNFGRAVGLLRSARRALDGDSPLTALALLDRYAVEFRGVTALVPEYEATRVLALCAAGQAEAGKRARDEFLDRQSGSPLAERVRKACGGR